MSVSPSFRSRALVGLTLLAGCGPDTVSIPPEAAELRLLHATPGLGGVDVQVGAATVIRGVPYGQSSPLVLVEGGRRRVVVRAGTAVLAELDQTLSTAHVNTIVVAGGVPQFSAQVTPDTGQVAVARANVRMVNVVGNDLSDPTLLQVKVKAPNVQNPDSVLTFGMDAKVASYGSLMYFDPGQFTFTYVPAGGSTVLATATFSVGLGQTRAVVLRRDDGGTYRVEVVAEP